MSLRHFLAVVTMAMAAPAAHGADLLPPAMAPVALSACAGSGALGHITKTFAWSERTLWHRGFVIGQLDNPRPSGHPFTEPSLGEPGVIVRDYCVADAVMTNGAPYAVYYAIEYGQGFASIGNNVDFCVLGLDPWQVHDGECRTVR